VTRLITAGLFVWLVGLPNPAPSPGVRSAPIVVDIGVEDSDGTPVTTLTAADFEIVVDSFPRPIVSFAIAQRPLVLAALVDVSVSMSRVVVSDDGRYLRTLETVIGELRTGDRAALGRVSLTFPINQIAHDASTLYRQAREVLTVPHVDRFGPSPLADSMISAVDAIAGLPGSRAILIWTDGQSTGNRFGQSDVVDRAVAAGVSIHVVMEQFPLLASNNQVRRDPCAAVASIVTATGGSCLLNFREQRENVAPVRQVRRILNGLHQRYAIGFDMDAADAQTHALEVRIKRPGLIVRVPRKVKHGG
jgi:hypothetical protein